MGRKEQFCKQNDLSKNSMGKGLHEVFHVKMSQQISIQLLGERDTLQSSPNGLMLSDCEEGELISYVIVALMCEAKGI